MLPKDKAAFPKFLYLDQNKWIDLARAHYGLPEGQPFLPVLSDVRAAVSKGTLCVPLSAVHMLETAAAGDRDRRERLARFIVSTTNDWAVLPHSVIREGEIHHAVLRMLGRPPTTSIREGVIRKGLCFALGTSLQVTAESPEIAAALQAFVADPETSVRLLVDAIGRESVSQERTDDELLVSTLEETRRRAHAQLDSDMRHRVELAELFIRGGPGEELLAVLKTIGLSPREFTGRFSSPNDFIAFFHDIPTVDVFVTLGLVRDNDLSRPIHRNDLKDMAFMSVAVPYSNIIVAERYWSSVVTRTKLDQKYETVVITDLQDLPRVLRDQQII